MHTCLTGISGDRRVKTERDIIMENKSKNNHNKEQNHSRLTALSDDALDTVAGGGYDNMYDSRREYLRWDEVKPGTLCPFVSGPADSPPCAQGFEEAEGGSLVAVKCECENCPYETVPKGGFY